MELLIKERSDSELVQLMQRGDRAAFEQIYFRYADFLFRFSLRRLNDRETASDFIQELFIKLWTKRETVMVKGELQAYLTFCLRNQIIDYFNHEQVKTKYVQRTTTFEADYGTLDLINYNDTRSILGKCIKTLPEKMREVFILSRLQDNSIDEISEKMNISRQTTKNQLSMAVKRLRVSLSSFL